jgi:hypothetical protein
LEPLTAVQSPAASKRPSAFRVFKYVIGSILLVNLIVYVAEDVTASLYLDEGASLADYLVTFAASIDYVAWAILIVLFELETSAHARGASLSARRGVILGLTAVCYAALVNAAYGYTMNLVETYQFEALAPGSVCNLVEENFGYLNLNARPVQLTAENCAVFTTDQMYRSPSDHLIATHENLMAIRKLGWVDVANSVAWLLVVLIFQIEITLKQLDKLTKSRLALCTGIKVVLYLVLTADAIYWTAYSAFIDSWDAWLWLIAFVLVDMNLLGWEDDARDPRPAQSAAVG